MRKCSKPEEYIYLVINKPAGFVCSAVSDSHKTVYDLLSPELRELVSGAPRGSRLHTVGRLDCDTSGLLLLTNDGKFSHEITAGRVTKTYRATLARSLSTAPAIVGIQVRTSSAVIMISSFFMYACSLKSVVLCFLLTQILWVVCFLLVFYALSCFVARILCIVPGGSS